MYKCIDCGEIFQDPIVEKWDVDDHLKYVNLCPNCQSEDVYEISTEQYEIEERRKRHEELRFYYYEHPDKEPEDFEEQVAREEAEDNFFEAQMKKDKEWV